jgi:hypothetical protein
MDFRIVDTFTDSLARRTGNEQKLVKTTAFDLRLPAQTLERAVEAIVRWSVCQLFETPESRARTAESRI